MPPNYVLFIWERKNGKMSFLDVEIPGENGKFVTSVCRKPTFSSVYTYLESFLPTTHKFGVFYTLVDRCFTLCSVWIKFHGELMILKELFERNVCLASFIDKCFKKRLNRLHIKKSTLPTVVK